MKTQLLTSIALVALMFSSCSKVDNLKEETSDQVRFTAGMKKATINNGITSSWQTGDQIGIFMLNTGTADVYGGMANKLYVTSDGIAFAPQTGHEIYYPVSDSRVDFIAYYPYRPSITALGDNYEIDLSTQANLAQNDLLWVKVNNGNNGYNKSTAGQVPLEFEHKLSKIAIVPNASTGMDDASLDWANMTVQVTGMNTAADFDLSTGTLSNPSAALAVAPFAKTAGALYEAIVLPATFAAAGDLQISFTVGTDVFVWKAAAGEQFEAGKQYTISLDIEKTGVNLSGITITDWATESRTGIAN